jgi:hypothetical protein
VSTKKPKSITQFLNTNYGGIWKYNGLGSWDCDDGKRYVNRHAEYIDDVGDAHGTRYVIYEAWTGIGLRVDFTKSGMEDVAP